AGGRRRGAVGGGGGAGGGGGEPLLRGQHGAALDLVQDGGGRAQVEGSGGDAGGEDVDDEPHRVQRRHQGGHLDVEDGHGQPVADGQQQHHRQAEPAQVPPPGPDQVHDHREEQGGDHELVHVAP